MGDVPNFLMLTTLTLMIPMWRPAIPHYQTDQCAIPHYQIQQCKYGPSKTDVAQTLRPVVIYQSHHKSILLLSRDVARLILP